MAETVYRFSATAALHLEAEEATLATPRGPVGFRHLDPGQCRVLEALDGVGSTEAGLLHARGDGAGAAGAAWVHYTLDRLVQLGMVDRLIGDPPLAVIEVIGGAHRGSGRALPEAPLRLSRFACLRQDGDRLVLESPRSHTRFVFTDTRGPTVLGQVAAPVVASEVEWATAVDVADAEALLTALFQEGFMEPAAPLGPDAPAEAQALREWEFHDLFFHSRSRQGRHSNPYGATYRFADRRAPLPAVKPTPEGCHVELSRPDLSWLRAHDLPFAQVVESRRSHRLPGPDPLDADQLGAFLYRSARVRGRRGTEHEEVSNRPYPGGGADYELEIYPIVHRVTDIEAGVYHYGPLEHRLVRLGDLDGAAARFATDVASKAPPGHLPDVLFAVTARFLRLTYKYQSIPYAIALKDLGVLYQTFYLTATAMGLAPCAVGGGDSELFAMATGLSPFVEPQIGEFMVSSRHPDDGDGHPLPDQG